MLNYCRVSKNGKLKPGMNCDTTLYFKKRYHFYNSNNSVSYTDLYNMWQKYWQKNLQPVAVHIYLIMQLGTSLCCYGNWFEKYRAQELTAANCIAPYLCKKSGSSYAGCGHYFLHRWKTFHGSPTSQQSKWLRVCSRDYHNVTSLSTNSYVPVRLSVNHWWYQLLSHSWVARVWCLWALAQRLMAATTVIKCCWNYCCQRSANYPVLLFV